MGGSAGEQGGRGAGEIGSVSYTHLGQQRVVGNHPAGILDEVVQQAILRRPQIDALAVDDDLMAVEVDG